MNKSGEALSVLFILFYFISLRESPLRLRCRTCVLPLREDLRLSLYAEFIPFGSQLL